MADLASPEEIVRAFSNQVAERLDPDSSREVGIHSSRFGMAF
jgi:hypothetical protein